MSDHYEVFISYSHDSPEHISYVLSLSNRLRADGIDCVLDQYEEAPPEGWPRWMDRKIRDAKYVVMVCTETYYRRIMGEEEAGVGHGVRWEGHLIYQHFYDAGTLNTKFVPIVRSSASNKHVPSPLRGATLYNLESDEGYDRLYGRLAQIPRVTKPPLGRREPLPVKPVKTNPSMYITSAIDIDQWNKAEWSATFFMHEEGKPPTLGLAFKNEGAAKAIFRGWRDRYGERDLDEELRISFIEGDIPGENPGYTVHISNDLDVFLARLKRTGYEYDEDLLVAVTRLNRMNPPPSATNLALFKQRYREFKTYFLTPGVISDDGRSLKPLLSLGIFKGKVLFRDVSEIGSNDLDRVVLSSGDIPRAPRDWKN